MSRVWGSTGLGPRIPDLDLYMPKVWRSIVWGSGVWGLTGLGPRISDLDLYIPGGLESAGLESGGLESGALESEALQFGVLESCTTDFRSGNAHT